VLFNSLPYAVFLILAWLAFLMTPSRWRVHLLVAVSYVFYATWNLPYAVLMFTLAIGNYLFGRVLMRCVRRRRLLLALFLTLDLAVLGVFKYLDFVIHTIATVLGWRRGTYLPLPTVDLVLPLGISFFTFEFIHYLVDVYRRQIGVHRFSEFHVFAAFFPTQIAGPIKRFQEFVPSLIRLAPPSVTGIESALRLIASGLVKKTLLADTLAPVANAGFTAAAGGTVGTVDAWAALLAFSFQIYFDFSGYTDIARGSAQLFGVWIPNNFNHPYRAMSVTDFWRRWHISLSSWLRDYLYIPLGGGAGHPRRCGTESLDHHGARRTVAWRGLALRRMGRVLGSDPSRRPHTYPLCPFASLGPPQRVGMGGHPVDRALRLGALPG